MNRPISSKSPLHPPSKEVTPSTAEPDSISKRRVLVVDDHPMTREGLTAIIDRQTDMEVCCQASNAAEALTELSRAVPDLMVTDMSMPGRSGLEFIKDVSALAPHLPMLVLSMHDEMLYAERALRAGARGYIMKDAGSARLLDAIRLILKGETYVSPQMSARIVEAFTGKRPRGSSSPIEKLSDREFEVFQLLGNGHSTKEVAQILRLSPKTIDVHRSHIKEKLQLKDAASLIHHAVRWVETQPTQPTSS